MNKDLYENYVQGHLNLRKGIPRSLRDLRVNSKAFNQHFSKFLPKNKDARIVDLGCGYGVLVWWLVNEKNYTNVSGVDLSGSQIRLGKSLFDGDIQKADIFSWLRTQKKMSVDLIVLRDVLEHIEKDYVIELLRLCRRVLRKNGSLLIQTVNGDSPSHGKVLYGDFTHITAYTSSSLSQVLMEAGFAHVRFAPWRPARQGKGLLRYLVWLLVEQLIRLILFAEGGKFRRIVTVNLISVAKVKC